MRVLVSGATGYIGGAVALKLLAQGHQVVGLARSPEKADKLTKLGIQAVIGSLSDHELIRNEAQSSDAVINTASSDDIAYAATVIDALKGTGKPFIQTSGGFIVADRSHGEAPAKDAYFTEDDILSGNFTPGAGTEQQINVNTAVIRAAHEGVRSIVLCASLVYGPAAGIKRHSQVIPMLIEMARTSGAVHHMNEGENVWSHVHIDDLSDLYLIALERADPGAFLFAENGESRFAEITQSIADSMGLAPSTPWPADQSTNFETFGVNFRVRGVQSRLLGWQPQHHDVVGSVADEV